MATLFSTLTLAVKRLWSQGGLVLCLLAGLIAAVGLLSSIPLYADAVHHGLLQSEVTDPGAAEGVHRSDGPASAAGAQRPPFAFLWRYVGAWHGDVTWDAYRPVDQYLAEQSATAIGLPLDLLVRHVRSPNLRLFPAADSAAFAEGNPLLWSSLGFVSGLAEHVEMVDGAFPGAPAGDEIPVLVSQALAERLGLQVGEAYVLFGSQGDVQIPARITGVWRPLDPADPFWFYQPRQLEELLLTSEEAFAARVVPALREPVSLAVWYQVFDGRHVRTSEVAGLLARVTAAQSRAAALLANTTLDVSPVQALMVYRDTARTLTLQLTILAIPVAGLVLYFVALIAGMVVRRDQAEIAVLRSRGTTRAQILGIYLLEALLVGGAGLAAGLVAGRWLAQLMGRTRTFLDPALLQAGLNPGGLDVVLTPTALRYGLLGVGLAFLALLVPALAASRHTVVTYRWERARTLLRPLYQRYFLDVLLLALPLYGWYLLRKQGSIQGIIPGLHSAPSDPYSNPLLLLVPALFAFGLALFALRFFPLVLGILARLASWLPGTTVLLTLRQLARSASQYTGPLLLLTLTLCLAAFSASMALTMDRHLEDRIYYQVGADLNLAEMGESTEEPQEAGLLGQSSQSTAAREEGPRWLFLPVSEHLRVPGVRAAARVGDYSATANLEGRQQAGRLLAVDRLDVAAVAFYRPDFAGGESLGGLMNRLAADPSNLLVSRAFLSRYALNVGDPLRLTVGAAGEFHAVEFTVAGPLDLFPTLYPQDGSFFVANLDYVHQGMGGTFPYDVWLATDEGANGREIVAGVRDLGLGVVASSDARAILAAEQTRPERQGLFGLLSVGFLAAAALTVLGFLVYAVVSFRRRFIELGMLRAVGLSPLQMAVYLAGEQAMLILSGAALGTLLGVGTSRIFIPYLQVGTAKTALVPPFVVQIAWSELWLIYAVFGAMFLVAVAVLIGLLLRMRVFEAVKLGEVG